MTLHNTLFHGDNLSVLRMYLPDESVDLIYLDPPFNSSRNYSALFKNESGGVSRKSHMRAPAFEDTWQWDASTEETYAELSTATSASVAGMLAALRNSVGPNQLMAYLVMMAVRLLELHRVLKPTGSLYLHCDPTASHYLKVLLDTIFGARHYRNEIVWSYKTGGASRRHFAKKHDILLFYSKTEQYVFHLQKEKSYMMHHYGFKKSEFLRDERGQYTWVYMKDVWEIPSIGSADSQRLGYPTQKPEALLERILLASSSEGDVVLDPFCGCGTTLAVAQRLGRKWLGIDINYLGIAYQTYRLESAFPGIPLLVKGTPTNVEAARLLARTAPDQFRWWALSLVRAKPVGGWLPDQDICSALRDAIDGIVPVNEGGKLRHLLVKVLASQDEVEETKAARAFATLLQREKADAGLLLTLDVLDPTLVEAITAVDGSGCEHLPMQILSIDQLLQGAVHFCAAEFP